MVGETIPKKIKRDWVDILRPDLGETGGVPWSLGPQQETWILIQICVCVCVCVCVPFLERRNQGSYKAKVLLITFFFFKS